MKRQLKIWGIALCSLFTAILLMVVGLIAFIYTQTGARWLGDAITSLVPNVRVVSVGLSGRSIEVEAFALRDEHGIWLHGNGITLTPDWSGLLRGKIGIIDFDMHELAFLRLPAGAEETEAESFSLPELPTFELVDALPHIYAKRLNIDAIHIAMPFLPEETTLRFHGALNFDLRHADESFITLGINTAGKEDTGLVLDVAAHKQEFHIANDMAVLLGSFIGLDDHKKLLIDLVSTPQENMAWSGKVTAVAEDLLQHDLQIDLLTASPVHLKLTGRNSGGENKYLSIDYDTDITFNLNENLITLHRFFMTGSGLNIAADGHYKTDDGDIDFNGKISAVNMRAPSQTGCPDCALNDMDITLKITGEAPHPDYHVNGLIQRVGMDGIYLDNVKFDIAAEHERFSFADIPYKLSASLTHTATLYAPGNGQNGNTQLSGPVAIQYADNMLTLKAELKGEPNMAFHADFDWPLPLTTDISRINSAPLRGELKGQLLLGPIVRLLGMAEHRARGLLTIDASLGGNAAKPVISGGVNLRNGFYENLIYGTKLTNIEAEAEWGINRLEIKNLSFNDGLRGRTEGRGHLSLRDANRVSYSFNLNASQMVVINTGGLVVNTSGDLTFEGTETEATLSGQINLHRAEVYLTQLPTGVSGFDNYEIVTRDEALHAPAQRIEASAFTLTLDLGVAAAGNISVRAQGFESDWGADLKITGVADDPQLNGRLFLRRGRLELASLMVELTRGDISFHGIATNPSLDIRGDIRGKGTDANLLIAGTAEIPTFTLRSSADLPPEEIVSQILFGQATTELSPFQALQIAQVLAILTGQSAGGLGALDALRRKTGLDTLSVSYDDATGTSSVAAGKYVSDRVYVGVEQGNTPGSSSVVTEISVNRRLSVETAVGGPSQDAKAGLKWRWDY